MSLIQALFMGLVQGVTEFLPVSSSGHLAILGNLFHINTDTGILFEVMLHLGTLIAVILAFWQDIARLIIEGIRMVLDLIENAKIFVHNKKDADAKRYKKIVHNNYRKFVLLILCTIPLTGVIGLMMKDFVVDISKTLLAPGIGLLGTGILLLVIDFFKPGKRIPKDVTYVEGITLGALQGVATLPGVSRSGATIALCLLLGFNRKFAVKFSFIMSIPAILGATILEFKELPGSNITVSQFFIYLAGAITAGVVGFFCIKTMLVLVQKKRFRFFAVYCFILGGIAIICHFVL